MIEMIICQSLKAAGKAVNIRMANTTIVAIFGAVAKNATTGLGAPS